MWDERNQFNIEVLIYQMFTLYNVVLVIIINFFKSYLDCRYNILKYFHHNLSLSLPLYPIINNIIPSYLFFFSNEQQHVHQEYGAS